MVGVSPCTRDVCKEDLGGIGAFHLREEGVGVLPMIMSEAANAKTRLSFRLRGIEHMA